MWECITILNVDSEGKLIFVISICIISVPVRMEFSGSAHFKWLFELWWLTMEFANEMCDERHNVVLVVNQREVD